MPDSSRCGIQVCQWPAELHGIGYRRWLVCRGGHDTDLTDAEVTWAIERAVSDG